MKWSSITRGRQTMAAGLMVVFTLLVGIPAVLRYNGGWSSSYDLGIFSQSAKTWASGSWPESTIRELPLLGDHFSPLLAVLGPLWLIWPDPRVLLITQAILLGLTVFLLAHFTFAARLHTWPTRLVLIAALISPAAFAGAFFEFHETAFAAPLVAWLAISLRNGARAQVLAASVGLLLVKEDLGLTVMAAAAVWWVLHRGLRFAALVFAIAVIGLLTATIVISLVNPEGQSNYLGYFGGKPSASANLKAENPWDIARFAPLALYTLATGVIGWRSPLSLLAVPTLGWRTASSNPNYWSVEFHYDLILWPVAVLALVDALRRTDLQPRRIITWVVVASLGASTVYGANLWWRKAHRGYTSATSLSIVDDLQSLARQHIPTGSAVAADGPTGPYLVSDYQVYRFSPGIKQPARYTVLRLDRSSNDLSFCGKRRALTHARSSGWPIWQRGDAVIIERADPKWMPTTC